MSGEPTPGVLLKGEDGTHYFYPLHTNLSGNAVADVPAPLTAGGDVADNVPRLHAFSVQRVDAESAAAMPMPEGGAEAAAASVPMPESVCPAPRSRCPITRRRHVAGDAAHRRSPRPPPTGRTARSSARRRSHGETVLSRVGITRVGVVTGDMRSGSRS